MIIALANQKGGVGKTTSVINIAAGLSLRNEKVLVIDLDPQGNTSSGFGFDKSTLEKTSYDVLINDVPIEEAILSTGRKNLFLCPANINLAGAEIELVDRKKREHVLRKALKPIREKYDTILIDCPPSLGLLTINALVAGDNVLIPMQAEYYALEGVTQLMETVSAIQSSLNKNLNVFAVLITMFDGRTQLAKQVSAEIKRYFGDKVFHTFIPRSVRLSEAPSHGKTIFEYEAGSKGAKAYMDVVRELMRKKRVSMSNNNDNERLH